MEIIIGIGGIIFGVILNEVVRRNSRIESFNTQIFNERLEKFNELYMLLHKTYEEATQFLESFNKYSDEEWWEISNSLIFRLVTFGDESGFFISDELKVQCSSFYMGIEDVDTDTLESYHKVLQQNHRVTIEMVLNESGINRINKSMRGIIGYKHNSQVIKYYRKLKRKQFWLDKKQKEK